MPFSMLLSHKMPFGAYPPTGWVPPTECFSSLPRAAWCNSGAAHHTPVRRSRYETTPFNVLDRPERRGYYNGFWLLCTTVISYIDYMIILFGGIRSGAFFPVSASVCDSQNWNSRSNSFVRAPSSGGGSNTPRPAVSVPHLAGIGYVG